MRRRRLLPQRGGGRALPARRSSPVGVDLTYLTHLVMTRFPVRSARTYLGRAIGNPVRVRLVEARRGERVGIVRSVEVQHARGGASTWVTGRRVLASGAPASHFVPDHLVKVEPVIEGPAARTGVLGANDEVVLHVPVRGYLRFLPAVFQGEGPVTSSTTVRSTSTALQRAGGGAPAAELTTETRVDEQPLRRFLFIFQHQMTTVTDTIDRLPDLTDPRACEPRFLPWLASWVGFDLDESLPVHQQRELVRRAIKLYRSRGTRRGLEDMVEVLTTAPVRVRERARPTPMVLGQATLAGGEDAGQRYLRDEPAGCYLVDPDRYEDTDFFVLLLESRRAFQERFGERAVAVLGRIADVVSRERPCHIAFTVRFEQDVEP